MLFLFTLPTGAFGATHTVEMRSNFYSPATVTIQVGDTVNWVNRGGSHDVVHRATPRLFKSPFPAQNFSFTFTTPGTYPYFCTPHDAFGMRGTVIVQAPPEPVPATLSSPRFHADGTFEFDVTATSGKTYQIEISSNALDWSLQQTISAEAATFTVRDASTGDGPRFYRVVEP
jgi:plastocyanin